MSVHFLNLQKSSGLEDSRETSTPAADQRAQRSQFWELRRTPAPATEAAFRHAGVGYKLLMVGAGPVLTWKLTVDVRNWAEQRVLRALSRTQHERIELPQVEASLSDEQLTLSTVEQGQHDELEVHALARAFAERLRGG
jgi:hypothetical protein